MSSSHAGRLSKSGPPQPKRWWMRDQKWLSCQISHTHSQRYRKQEARFLHSAAQTSRFGRSCLSDTWASSNWRKLLTGAGRSRSYSCNSSALKKPELGHWIRPDHLWLLPDRCRGFGHLNIYLSSAVCDPVSLVQHACRIIFWEPLGLYPSSTGFCRQGHSLRFHRARSQWTLSLEAQFVRKAENSEMRSLSPSVCWEILCPISIFFVLTLLLGLDLSFDLR